MTSMVRQSMALSLLNLRNLRSRWSSCVVTVVGITGVVVVMVSILSMGEGFAAALTRSAHPDRAILLREGSNNEITSWLSESELAIASQLEGIRAASGELVGSLEMPVPDRPTTTVAVRGVDAMVSKVRPEIHLTSGRWLEAGRDEVVVGAVVAQELPGLQVGQRIDLRGSPFAVVGHFAAGGTNTDSEIWLDRPVMGPLFRRVGIMNLARVVVDSQDRDGVAKRIHDDPRLGLRLISEAEFYEGQSRARAGTIRAFGLLIGSIMAVGAVLAALNTMNLAVSARTAEIGTLRALGFGPASVMASVVVEATLLACVGGVLGGILVFALFNGYHASTLNGTSFTQVAFEFRVTPRLLRLGLFWAFFIGLAGGALPALRAARLPVAQALRGS